MCPSLHVGKLAEDKRIEEMRASARARRAAKEEEENKQKSLQLQEKEQKQSGTVKDGGEDSLDSLKVKFSQGIKLTHKGKSLYQIVLLYLIS